MKIVSFKIKGMRVTSLALPEDWIVFASNAGEIYTATRNEGSNQISADFVLNNHAFKFFHMYLGIFNPGRILHKLNGVNFAN